LWVVLISLALLAGCRQEAEQAQASTLVLAVPSDPVGLDPATKKAEPVGSEIILNLFDTLVAWAPPGFQKLEGRLADDWQLSADGRQFSLHVRPGVTFQNGRPVDALAVKRSLDRARTINPFLASSFGVVADVVVTGPLSLRIDLTEPSPMFAALLAQPQAAIVDVQSVQPGHQPVGSGAFSLQRYTPDTSVILQRNPDYFRGPARLERLVYRIIPDASTRRLELKYGSVDVSPQLSQLSTLPTDDIQSFEQDHKVEVVQAQSQIIRQLEFNNDKVDSPVHGLRVRQAMAYAVDYDGLVNGILGATVERVYGPLPTASWAFDPSLRDLAPRHDVARARQLLAEAGYPPGKLKLTLYAFQGDLWGNVATFLQANFAQVGIDLKVEQSEFSLLRARHIAGDFDIALDGRQPWYNDPDAHITVGYLSSLARSAMTFRMPADPALDQLIIKARSDIDQHQRAADYQTIQRTLMARVPAIYLFSNKLILFKRPQVRGLEMNSAPPLNEYWSVYKEMPAP